ncbi:gamma-glutamyl-gamma-aminobutyrate hydrolase family protein [Brevibacterium sp. JSBI002]|uniref:gamma-glutamyl-gamma-aminobutyrate hydrolase family protein n=1 Tax=Brevibacterium sp. JSBI002 TaxID=2886045 RepID=UPI002230D7B2|nr:gamma-glutamyl-gamma-aminobutyrate hydrolase family protein [Brevibacterium sp. JSBI002]UZD62840.1 gamma-glutamyl-gamma-aminobutyrate hydrolase family protein [Brevibacterium sp. JSBI002]
MASNGSDSSGSRRPLIGLPTYYGRGQYGVWDRDAAFLPSVYVTAVTRAGGRVVLLPPEEPWSAAEAAELDGFVLTGGDDVDPRLYGAEPHERTQEPNLRRDRFEVSLYEHAQAADIPVLAICRGAQIVNTVHGGTLHQHVPDLPGLDPHEAEIKDEFAEVAVTTVPETTTAAIIGTGATVRCHHHQSIDRLGEELVLSARAQDGTVEAFEDDEARMVAVQWHPEETLDDLRLFADLVERARKRVHTRMTETKEEARL